jgi:MFS family permease
VQIYALTQNSAYVGLSGLFALVPLVVFGLWGGAWADAMDRRVLLIIASCGLAAASLLLWAQAALAADNVWVVLCLLSVQQAFFAINSPTRSAAIPRMLPSDQLPAANSLNMTVMQFGAIVGPLLAGVLLRWIDLSTLLPDRRDHLRRAHLGDGAVAADAGERHRRRRTVALGVPRSLGRIPIPRGPYRRVDVVRRRPDRDDLRHAAGTVPADRAPELRRGFLGLVASDSAPGGL